MPLEQQLGQQYGNQGTQPELQERMRDCKTTKELLQGPCLSYTSTVILNMCNLKKFISFDITAFEPGTLANLLVENVDSAT